jgi:hypothetical protein
MHARVTDWGRGVCLCACAQALRVAHTLLNDTTWLHADGDQQQQLQAELFLSELLVRLTDTTRDAALVDAHDVPEDEITKFLADVPASVDGATQLNRVETHVVASVKALTTSAPVFVSVSAEQRAQLTQRIIG